MYFKGHLIHAFPVPPVFNHHCVILCKRSLMSQEAFGDLQNPRHFFPKTKSSILSRVNKLEENQGLRLFSNPKVWISERNLVRCIFPFAARPCLFSPSLGQNTRRVQPLLGDSCSCRRGLSVGNRILCAQGKRRLRAPNNNNLLQILGYQKLKEGILAKHLALLHVKWKATVIFSFGACIFHISMHTHAYLCI